MLEEDICFNAGRRSVLTAAGCIELDAAIMDGRTRAAGAVAGLRTTRAPVSSARRLLKGSPVYLPQREGCRRFCQANKDWSRSKKQLVRNSRAATAA